MELNRLFKMTFIFLKHSVPLLSERFRFGLNLIICRCATGLFFKADGKSCFEKVLGMSMIKQRRKTECPTAEQKN